MRSSRSRCTNASLTRAPYRSNDCPITWVSIVIPHELAHLVFDAAVQNPYHPPPSWLNEGLAVYLAQGYEADDRSQVRAAVESASLMPLSALTGMFPTTRARFSLAYAESVSAIDHLVRTHGTAALVTLVRAYADGVSDDEAVLAALDECVDRIVASIEQRRGVKFHLGTKARAAVGKL